MCRELIIDLAPDTSSIMLCCLNPNCDKPQNPDGTKFCQNCGTPIVLLRNHYRPIKPLGAGEFGKTYLAEDIDKLNERCVIKQLAPNIQGGWALKKAKELFEEEARQLQQLEEHPQIPTLLAYFEQDNRLYLVQQYIEGQTLLQELTQQGAFSEQKIRELLHNLLDILKFLHQHNVIHRDIKPENIICRPLTSSPSPIQGEESERVSSLVLIDFGVAKHLKATAMATPGTTIGSLGYVPIEQMQGGEAYPASDLYSLGVTCFHLLSGIHPWELWKAQGYGWVSNWRQYLKQPVSQELGEILDKLLQQNYEQRYQSAEEVLADLNRRSPPPPPVPSKVDRPRESFPSQPPVSSAETSPSPTSPSPAIPLPVTSSPQVSPKPVASRKPKAKFKKPLLVGGAIMLLGLIGTQIYGYFRYGLSVISQIFLITSLQSRSLLKTTLTGHPHLVNSVAISPDGQTLVNGNVDDTIKIWNLRTGELKNTLTGHTHLVSSVAISPDGQTLVSGSWDEKIKIWNLATGELKDTLTGHKDKVNSVAISPDGETLVSGSKDKTIKIWDLKTGKLKNTLTEHIGSVNSVTISPDGQTLVSGSGSFAIKIWNLKTGELKNTLTGHLGAVTSLAISPDGQTLVSGSVDDTIKIWNLRTGELKHTLTRHKDKIYSVTISPDGQTLVSGSDDKTIKIWNLRTGELKFILIGHTDWVRFVAISPDGQTLVSGSRDNTINIWRMP